MLFQWIPGGFWSQELLHLDLKLTMLLVRKETEQGHSIVLAVTCFWWFIPIYLKRITLLKVPSQSRKMYVLEILLTNFNRQVYRSYRKIMADVHIVSVFNFSLVHNWFKVLLFSSISNILILMLICWATWCAYILCNDTIIQIDTFEHEKNI